MGYGAYDTTSRSVRAATLGFATKSVDQIFTQQKERRVHEEMDPKNIKVRECRDSAEHPNVIPVLLFLDETGSMTTIPHSLIKEGLPTLMGGLIQRGADVSLMFGAIGDHESDSYPLQVGQFESGDAELDLWLTRTFLEGNGGGNGGESYHLAWHFANNYVSTDAWEKRGQKPFLFTIGDEPVLKNLPSSAIQEIYGKPGESVTTENLLKEAQSKFKVYHLHITHSDQARRSLKGWKDMLGENCIEVPNYNDIPAVITKMVVSASNNTPLVSNTVTSVEKPKVEEVSIPTML